MRCLAGEALATCGGVFRADALLPGLSRSLDASRVAKVKALVLDYACKFIGKGRAAVRTCWYFLSRERRSSIMGWVTCSISVCGCGRRGSSTCCCQQVVYTWTWDLLSIKLMTCYSKNDLFKFDVCHVHHRSMFMGALLS